LGKCVRWCEASVMATETNRAKKFYRFERLPTPNALSSISPNGRLASGLSVVHYERGCDCGYDPIVERRARLFAFATQRFKASDLISP